MNNWLIWSLLSALFAGATVILAKIGVTTVDSINTLLQLGVNDT